MEEVLGALPLEHVQTLTVDCTVGMLNDVGWWTSIHRMFPRLENLYLAGEMTAEMFLFAFTNINQIPNAVSPSGEVGHTLSWFTDQYIAHEDSSTGPGEEKHENMPHNVQFTIDNIVFPRLRSLHMPISPLLAMFPHFLDMLVDALVARRELGSPLEKLEFRRDMGPVFQRYIGRLREIVPVILVNDVSNHNEEAFGGGDKYEAMDTGEGKYGEDEDSDDDMEENLEQGEEQEWDYGENSESEESDGHGSDSEGEAESGDSDFEWPGIRGSRL